MIDFNSTLLICLERAALAVGRLDQALTAAPLRRAWIYRARVIAACRHTAIDGRRIDPFRLAAAIEGLRAPAAPAAALFDRGQAHLAEVHALGLLDRMAAAADIRPVCDPGEGQGTEVAEEEEARESRRDVRAALTFLHAAAPTAPALIAAATGVRAGLQAGLPRDALRAATARYFADRGLTRLPLPLLAGADALRPDAPDEPQAATVDFLNAVRREAEEGLRLLSAMTGAWTAAHDALRRPERTPGARKLRADSALPRAVDALAAAPFLAPTQLARLSGGSLRGAGLLLAKLVDLGIAAEVTGRGSRRLYAMAALAPVREETAGPRRKVTGRKRGRPPDDGRAVDTVKPTPPTDAPPRPILPPPLPPPPAAGFDADMAALLADADRAVRQAQAALARLAGPSGAAASDPEHRRH